MNTAADRQAIADAASTVAGVKVSPRYKQLTKNGDGSVRLANLVRSSDGFGFIATYQVMVKVDQDVAAAETWIDGKADALVDALASQLVVTRIEPVELVMDTGRVPAVLIEGTRAAD